MKLLFYSGGQHGQNDTLDAELASMVGRGARITYIPSLYVKGGGEWFENFKRDKSRFGLRKHLFFPVDRPFTKRELVSALSSDALFLSGGNTFYFLKHLRRSGLLATLPSYVKKGGVLFGLSAGSIIMTPSIALSGVVPGESDENEVGLKNLRGLALVNFEVYPHYSKSKVSVRALSRYTKSGSRQVYAFPDGSGIVINGAITSFHGDVACFRKGETFAP
jgi:dipeptidase E